MAACVVISIARAPSAAILISFLRIHLCPSPVSVLPVRATRRPPPPRTEGPNSSTQTRAARPPHPTPYRGCGRGYGGVVVLWYGAVVVLWYCGVVVLWYGTYIQIVRKEYVVEPRIAC